jgi:hypothetical protein
VLVRRKPSTNNLAAETAQATRTSAEKSRGQPNLHLQIPRHTFANILRRGRTLNWQSARIRYCNRPFRNVEEMDQTILERLNASVKAKPL